MVNTLPSLACDKNTIHVLGVTAAYGLFFSSFLLNDTLVQNLDTLYH